MTICMNKHDYILSYGADSENAEYPVENLDNDYVKSKWKATLTTAVLNFAISSGATCFGLAGCNAASVVVSVGFGGKGFNLECKNRIFNEEFEDLSYDMDWSETVGAGCTINEATTPGVPPPTFNDSWNSQYLLIIQAGGVANFTSIVIGDSPISYFRCEIICNDLSGLTSDGDSISLILCKNNANTTRCFSLNAYRTGGVNKFRLFHYDDGTISYSDTMWEITIARTYRVEVKWDSTNDLWEWKIDDITIDSGTLLTGHVELGRIVIGDGSVSSDAGTFFVDLIAIDNNDWVGAEDEHQNFLLLPTDSFDIPTQQEFDALATYNLAERKTGTLIVTYANPGLQHVIEVEMTSTWAVCEAGIARAGRYEAFSEPLYGIIEGLASNDLLTKMRSGAIHIDAGTPRALRTFSFTNVLWRQKRFYDFLHRIFMVNGMDPLFWRLVDASNVAVDSDGTIEMAIENARAEDNIWAIYAMPDGRLPSGIHYTPTRSKIQTGLVEVV